MIYIDFSHKIQKEIAIAIFELPNKSEVLTTVQLSNKQHKNSISLSVKQQKIAKISYFLHNKGNKDMETESNNLNFEIESGLNYKNHYAQNINSKFEIYSNSNLSNDDSTEIYYSSLTRPLKVNCSVKGSNRLLKRINSKIDIIEANSQLNKINNNETFTQLTQDQNKVVVNYDKSNDSIVDTIKSSNIREFCNKFNNTQNNKSNIIRENMLKNANETKYKKERKVIYNFDFIKHKQLKHNKQQQQRHKQKHERVILQKFKIDKNNQEQQLDHKNDDKYEDSFCDVNDYNTIKNKIDLNKNEKEFNSNTNIENNENYNIVNYEKVLLNQNILKEDLNTKDLSTNLNQNIQLETHINNNCNENLQDENVMESCNINLQAINHDIKENEFLPEAESKINTNESKQEIFTEPKNIEDEHILKVKIPSNIENQQKIIFEENKVRIAKEDAEYWARKWLIEYGININYKKTENRERIMSGDYDNVNIEEYTNFYSKNCDYSKEDSNTAETPNVAKLREKIAKELNMKVFV